MTCSATRLILLAGAVGMLTASVFGSDAVGWLAAGIAVAIALVAGRLLPERLGGSTCAVPGRVVETEAPAESEHVAP